MQRFASRANLRKVLTAAKDLPKIFGLFSNFTLQESLGEDNAPGPNRENQKNRQNKSCDRGGLAENFEQVQLIQMRLLKIKNLTVRH